MKAKEDTTVHPEAAVCQQQLDALLESSREVHGALVSTADGFEVAARIKRQVSPEKLAAIASSLLALAEAISKESAIGSCRDLVIDASAGRALLMDIPV